MPTLVVLYPTPKDATTFDRRYRDEHAPMVLKHFPGVRFKVMRVTGTPSGPAPYGLVVQLGFDSAAAMQTCTIVP